MSTQTIIAGATGAGAGAKPRTVHTDNDGNLLVVPADGSFPVTGTDPTGAARAIATTADGGLTGAYRSIVVTPRPANTTAYSAGDIVGGASVGYLTFSGIGPAGGHVMLTSANLMVAISAIPAGMTSFRLHLYDQPPPSNAADNAAWDIPAGDRSNYLGYVDVGSPADIGSTLHTQVDAVNKHLKLASNSTALYGYLVTAAGYTPAANSEVYVTTLHAVAL